MTSHSRGWDVDRRGARGVIRLASPVGGDVAPATSERRRSRRGALLRVARRRESLLVVLTLAVFFVTTALQSGFGSSGDIAYLLESAMPLAVLAVGQTMVCLVRGIDSRSRGSSVLRPSPPASWRRTTEPPSWLLLPLALGIGIGLGSINGLFVVFARIPPIIVTLGTLIVYQGIQLGISGSRTVVSVPNSYITIGSAPRFGHPLPVDPRTRLLIVVGDLPAANVVGPIALRGRQQRRCRVPRRHPRQHGPGLRLRRLRDARRSRRPRVPRPLRLRRSDHRRRAELQPAVDRCG